MAFFLGFQWWSGRWAWKFALSTTQTNNYPKWSSVKLLQNPPPSRKQTNKVRFTDASFLTLCIFSSKRRRCQSSGSLPPFYRGIFESDDDKDSHLDYQLPYDIFWFSKQREREKETQPTIEVFPISPALPDHSFSSSPMSLAESTLKKKKASQPKQKRPVPYKKIQRNQYADQLQQKLLASPNTEKSSSCNCKASDTCDDDACLNRMSFTECSTSCACGTSIRNRSTDRSLTDVFFARTEMFKPKDSQRSVVQTFGSVRHVEIRTGRPYDGRDPERNVSLRIRGRNHHGREVFRSHVEHLFEGWTSLYDEINSKFSHRCVSNGEYCALCQSFVRTKLWISKMDGRWSSTHVHVFTTDDSARRRVNVRLQLPMFQQSDSTAVLLRKCEMSRIDRC